MRHSFLLLILAVVVSTPAAAQIVVADKGEQTLSIGGYLQPQYTLIDVEHAEAADTTTFRRMVLTVQGTTSAQWLGTFQADLAPVTSGDRVVIKDANLQYLGWRAHGLTVTIGNQKPPFSRSLITSSSRRDLIERPFTGDRSLGSLGRAIGVKVDGAVHGRTLLWSGMLASSHHAPNVNQIRTDGIAEAGDTWNEGILVVGRAEIQPRGDMPREQGDFHGGAWKYGAAIAAYAWHNDGDRNLFTSDGAATSTTLADTANARGFEASAALRGHGWSIDTEFERITSHTVDPTLTAGLYEDGDASLVKASVEAGRMLIPRRFELVGAYDVVNAGTYDRPWQRFAAGASWYALGHNVKFQIMHRRSHDDRGIRGVRINTTFAQAQFAF